MHLHLADARKHMARPLPDADVVHAGDHARRDDVARSQDLALLRPLVQREGQRAQRAGLDGDLAGAHGLAVDEGLDVEGVQLAPVGDLGADNDAPVVAEVGDDRPGADVVQRRERAAGDFHADVHGPDEGRHGVGRPVGLAGGRVLRHDDDDLGLHGRKAAVEDRALRGFAGGGAVDVGREGGADQALFRELRRERGVHAGDLPALDRVGPAGDGRGLHGIGLGQRGGRRARVGLDGTAGSAGGGESFGDLLGGAHGTLSVRRRAR
jgi:hypothetical protein